MNAIVKNFEEHLYQIYDKDIIANLNDLERIFKERVHSARERDSAARKLASEQRQQRIKNEERKAAVWAYNKLLVGMIVKVRGSRNKYLKKVTSTDRNRLTFTSVAYDPKTDQEIKTIAAEHMFNKVTHIYVDGQLQELHYNFLIMPIPRRDFKQWGDQLQKEEQEKDEQN